MKKDYQIHYYDETGGPRFTEVFALRTERSEVPLVQRAANLEICHRERESTPEGDSCTYVVTVCDGSRELSKYLLTVTAEILLTCSQSPWEAT